MTTHTAWPVALDDNDSESDGATAAWADGSSTSRPVPAPLSGAFSTDRATSAAPGRPWRVPSVVLLLLVLADVTLTAVLLGGQTWWAAAAAWGAGLFLVVRSLRPRLV